MKFGRVVSEIYEWTDIQTDRHANYNTALPSWLRSNYNAAVLAIGQNIVLNILIWADENAKENSFVFGIVPL